MIFGEIYYCDPCEQLTRFEKVCPECGNTGNKVGWMVTNEEM